jgi:hypothetical protein
MSVEQGIVTALRNDATVGPLIANGTSPETYRVYHELMPQGVAYPAIVYARANTDRIMTLAGPSNLTATSFTLDVWADSTASVKAVAAGVKNALDGVTTTLGGISINHCYMEAESDLSVFADDRDDRRVTLDFVIWLSE